MFYEDYDCNPNEAPHDDVYIPRWFIYQRCRFYLTGMFDRDSNYEESLIIYDLLRSHLMLPDELSIL